MAQRRNRKYVRSFGLHDRECPRGPMTKKGKERWESLRKLERTPEYTRIQAQMYIALRCLSELKGMRAVGETVEWLLLEHIPDSVWDEMMEAADVIFDTHAEPECLEEQYDIRNMQER